MFRIVIIALSLVACLHAPPPSAPTPPAVNAAETYAQTLNANATCALLSTAVPRQPDAALCDFDQVLAYCRVGVGAGSECKTIINFPALEQQAQRQAAARAEAERARQAAPAATAAPAKSRAKPEPEKK